MQQNLNFKLKFLEIKKKWDGPPWFLGGSSIRMHRFILTSK